MSWQPIETAPLGTLALVYDNGLIGSALLSQRGEWLNVSIGASGKIKPTHWQPLPEPPAEQSSLNREGGK